MTGFQKIKGTRDILPDEWSLWEELLDKAKRRLRAYGYQFIVTPTLERTELFVRSIGESTDIVEKEMYTFKDRGGRSLTLRPEGTAPVVRAYLENHMIPPVKLAYFMNMFRAEKPQKGRYREFWHLGVEVIGVEDPLIDAEVIQLGYELLKDFGLEGVKISLNSIGTMEERKVYREALLQYLKPKRDELCEDCQRRIDRNPLRALDCKIDGPKLTDFPKLLDFLGEESRAHFSKVRSYLDEWKIPYEIEPRLVRGLDYYTRSTFEYILPGFGAQDAVGGGGRYDGLVEELGGKPTPAIGFALGMDRISLALVEKRRVEGPRYFVATVGEEARRYAIGLVRSLRERGIPVEFSYDERSLKSQMKLANRLKARFTIIVGEDELKEKKVKVRDMESGEERLVDPADLT